MISLDQILILEQKVESAVKKISQLQAENDALRSKCAELTNALSSKSEQLSSFEQDQGLIESRIAQIINRFANIENSVMDAITQNTTAPVQAAAPIRSENKVENFQVQQHIQEKENLPEEKTFLNQSFAKPVSETKNEVQEDNPFDQVEENQNQDQPSFFDMNEVEEDSNSANNDDTQFDIF
ncbi:MAG: cell division protein ZapB [Treponema sp.]|nr:cell division protein ZapB [Treponema sp.]